MQRAFHHQIFLFLAFFDFCRQPFNGYALLFSFQVHYPDSLLPMEAACILSIMRRARTFRPFIIPGFFRVFYVACAASNNTGNASRSSTLAGCAGVAESLSSK